MAGKRTNVLREYHLLIKREAQGFEWQIRYNRHATPIQRSPTLYATQEAAATAGDEALSALRQEVRDVP